MSKSVHNEIRSTPDEDHVNKGFSLYRASGMAEPREKDKDKDKDKQKKSGLFRRSGSQKNVKVSETTFSAGEGVPPTSQRQPPPPTSRSLKSIRRSQSAKAVKEKSPNYEGLGSTSSGSQVRPTGPSGVGLNPQPQDIPPRNREGNIPMEELKVMVVDACKMDCR